MLLITHNLGIVAEACDRVAVMYAGHIVEEGDARQVFSEPGPPVHAGAAALDDLAAHHRAALHPRCAARPRRSAEPAARSIPAARTRCGSAPTKDPDRGPPCGRQRVACWLHGPDDRIPDGGRQPLPERRSALPTKPDPGGDLGGDLDEAHGPLLEVHDLEVHFALQGNFVQRLRAATPARSRPSTA